MNPPLNWCEEMQVQESQPIKCKNILDKFYTQEGLQRKLLNSPNLFKANSASTYGSPAAAKTNQPPNIDQSKIF